PTDVWSPWFALRLTHPAIYFRVLHTRVKSRKPSRGRSVVSNLSDELRESALAYHRGPRPGKLEIAATKPLANQRDLALAYSPGVAAACEAITADPREAAALTARANLVAVVSNGTACSGLAISVRSPASR